MRELQIMLFGLLALAGMEAAASGGGSLLEGLTACRAVAGDAERLRCFDALSRDVSAQQPGSERDRAAAPAEEFGGEMLRRSAAAAPANGVEQIEAVLAAVERRPRGEHLFRLSNGQLWTETEAGRFRYRRGEAVTIARTPLGGYMLSTTQGRATRVRRLE